METRLRRGLFGYSRKSVTAVVNDREMSIITASRGSKEAKDEVEGLAAELDKRRIEAADLQARNRDLESKLDDVTERVRAVESSGSTSTTAELTDTLDATERAIARLTDRARRNAEKQLGETEQVHEALRKEIDRLAAWRTRMAPLAQTIPDSIEEVRKEASALSDRLAMPSLPRTMPWTPLPRTCPSSPQRRSLLLISRLGNPTSSRWETRATKIPQRYPTLSLGSSRGRRTGRHPRAPSSSAKVALGSTGDQTRSDDDVHLTLTEPRTWTSVAEGPSGARPSAFPDDVPGLVDP